MIYLKGGIMGLSRDRKGNKKEGELNKWIKTLLSGVIGGILSAVILSTITWCVVLRQIESQYQQNKKLNEDQFQHNYDLNTSRMVVDVLLANDASLHPLLLELLDRVEDGPLRRALVNRIKENPSVSKAIKQEAIKKLGVQIIHMEGDLPSKELADRIKRYLTDRDYWCVITPKSKDWYTWNVQGAKVATIRYSKSEKDFAKSVEKILDEVFSEVKFNSYQIGGSMSPASISIVLPDKSLPPVEPVRSR
jgi:hypothetical protein